MKQKDSLICSYYLFIAIVLYGLSMMSFAIFLSYVSILKHPYILGMSSILSLIISAFYFSLYSHSIFKNKNKKENGIN